jgi:hypothetical protein
MRAFILQLWVPRPLLLDLFEQRAWLVPNWLRALSAHPSSASMAKVEAKEKDKGGRPPEYDWDSVKAYALGLVREHGMPGRGNRRLRSKSQLAEAVLDEWSSKYDQQLAISTVRRHVGRWLSEL